VKRREVEHVVYLLQDIVVHDDGIGEVSPAVDEPVAHGSYLPYVVHRAPRPDEGVEDAFHRGAVVGHRQRPDTFPVTARRVGKHGILETYPLDHPLGEHLGRSGFEQPVLDG